MFLVVNIYTKAYTELFRKPGAKGILPIFGGFSCLWVFHTTLYLTSLSQVSSFGEIKTLTPSSKHFGYWQPYLLLRKFTTLVY